MNLKAAKRELPKYVYPDCVVTSAAVGYLCKQHTPWRVRRGECAFIRKLDAQGANGIFGAGYLLSERAAAGVRARRARKAVFGAFRLVRPEQAADGADGFMATSGRECRFYRPPLCPPPDRV